MKNVINQGSSTMQKILLFGIISLCSLALTAQECSLGGVADVNPQGGTQTVLFIRTIECNVELFEIAAQPSWITGISFNSFGHMILTSAANNTGSTRSGDIIISQGSNIAGTIELTQESDCTAQTWYLDADGDGFYPSGGTLTQCTSPGTGWGTTTKTAGDCNDTDPGLNPNTTWYLDADGDGFYPSGGTQNQCTSPGSGWTRTTKTAGDCDDGDAQERPGQVWYLDADGDGYYPSGGTVTQCLRPSGSGWGTTVKTAGDCNDSDANLDPDTTWYLDADGDGFYPTGGTQNQCTSPGSGWTRTTKTAGDCDDGDAQERPGRVWYLDADGDGYYPSGGTVTQCLRPSGSGWGIAVKSSGDCNDNDANLDPDTTWYLDADGDGFYPTGGTATQCTSPGTGWSTTLKTTGDCNDGDINRNPNTLWYEDNNNDGYADVGAATVQQCTEPSGNWTLNSELNPCGVSLAEKQALIDLYNSTNGDNWTNSWDIVNDEPCDWFGVTIVNDAITVVDLRSNNLSGFLPTSIGDLASLETLYLSFNAQLSGSLPVSLSNIIGLESLFLEQCSLTGNIPVEYGNLTALKSFIVGFSSLSGTIPSSFGNLINLESIGLSGNDLSGSIPVELGNLPVLRTLNLNGNQLTGPIPSQLGNLTSLQALSLNENQLSGTIPAELGNLSNLTFMRIDNNQFSGAIPAELGNLSSIQILDLGLNQLTGAIPLELGNLTTLEYLGLRSNLLTGTIPASFGSSGVLEILELSSNQLSGDIPDLSGNPLVRLYIGSNGFLFNDFESEHPAYVSTISNYTFAPQANVDQAESLSVFENGSITLTSAVLTSPNNSYQWFKDGVAIPGATSKDYVISNATTADAGTYYFEATNSIVTGLTLTRNDITLTVDADPCGVSAAERQVLLDLYASTNGDNWTNTLAGNQPWDPGIPVCDWFGVTVVNGDVVRLQLNSNQLSGTIPTTLSQLTSLTHLDFGVNQLTGTIPSELGQLQNLVLLSLRFNQLTGSIPLQFGQLVNLEKLDFNSNQLSGPIPSGFDQLQNLTVLALQDNQLSGNIPENLGNLTALIDLYLQSNALSGTIPTQLGQLQNLEELRLNNNQLTGTIPLELGQILTLSLLTLNDNQLSGNIPPQLGQLANLTGLNLSNNLLTGDIPSELGQATILRSLSLQNNQLSGSIPGELTLLSNMVGFNVTNNNLSGSIPSGFASISLNVFFFEANSFIFSDFELQHSTYVANIGLYGFSPQAKVDQEETLSVFENGTITLTSTALTSPNNSYQWFKDGVAIPGATSKDYVISNATADDAGVYYFEATNSIVTGLTLTRNDITLTVTPDTCGVSAAERQALLDLYNSTNGDNWTNTLAGNQPWDPGIPVCDWFGVTVANGDVTEVIMTNNGLIGTLPASIGNLSNLQYLRLTNNNLTGNIPLELGNVTTLSRIDLGQNSLSGPIPTEFGNLTGLTQLLLNANQINGTIPVQLNNLSQLTRVILAENQLSGSIPIELGNLQNLELLDLGSNQLNGPIPNELGNLSSLENLILNDNQLSGTIPISLTNLPNLVGINLSSNLLTGSVLSEFANLSGLQGLFLNDNELSGSVPAELGNLTSIRSLTLANNQLSGAIPNLTGNPLSIRLTIENNFFVFSNFESEHLAYDSQAILYTFAPQAKVDQEENLSVLENGTITLTSTDLISPNNSYQWFKDGVAIPGATNKDYLIANATAADAGTYYFESTNSIVTGLTLTRNDITLSVDPDTCGVSTAERQALLDLYNSTNGDNWTNTLAGNQPWDPAISVCDWFGVLVVGGQVTELDLGDNNLDGTLPSSIGDLTNLVSIELSNDNITGVIPTEIGQMTSLETILLNNNNFSGSIPASIGNLTSLRRLTLIFNQLSGEIPNELGQLSNLENLELGFNQLTGNIPTSIAGIQSLQNVFLDDNLLSGPIAPAFSTIPNLAVLFFRNNAFVFSDFENEHDTYFLNLDQYGFSPQAKVDEVESLEVSQGGTITLTSTDLTSVNNSYQWFKDGVAIPGATTKDYVISNASATDAGTYYFEATNSIVTGLTLTRNDITLTIGSGSQIIVQEFCTMNGQPTIEDFVFGTINGFPAEWFLSETGGTPIPFTTPLQEGVTYWADDTQDGSDVRVPHEAVIDRDIPTGSVNQSFDFSTTPTLAEIVVQGSNASGVIWFDAVDATTPLPNITALVDGQTYFAQSDIVGAECRLGITVRDNGPTEVCEEILVQSGSGGSGSIIDGSFELASSVIIPNNRNESMGGSGWGATQGTPDTFGTPYNNSNDPYLLDAFTSSPNGGICAGGLRIGNSAEAFAANINGLTPSTTYVVEFYQANVSNVLSSEVIRDANGFWEVNFGGLSKTTTSIFPSLSGNTSWRKQSLEFNASSSTQLLEFTVASTAQDQNNAYPVYMLIDGIRVYEKPADIFTTVCYDVFTQVFCNYDEEDEPTIGDLEAPNGGNVTWYSSRTGGTRYFSNEILADLPSFVVWADDSSGERVAVEILFDFGAPLGDEYQFFDQNDNPTLADILVAGTNITWHSSFTSTAVLPLSTPLTDDTIYYAAQDGNQCRLSVLVELGIPDPIGSQYQEFCSTTNPTIADLIVQTTNPGYSVRWYSSETGGSLYNSTDTLENGQTYYAEQTDGVNVSENRIPFVVSIIDISVQGQIQDIDIEVPNNSTVQSLSDFFSTNPGIVWYDDPFEGTAYAPGAQLLDGETYYGRVATGGVCETLEVLAVTITLAEIVEPELITCIKFIPQPGRHYVIGAWTREQPVEAEPAGTASFDEVKESFIELLGYLVTKILNKEEIPSALVLKEDPNAPDADDLLPFVRNTADRNLTVYNFAFEKETIGGVEKSVGFSFALAPGSSERFVYLTPRVQLSFGIFGSLLDNFDLGYRFPIRNYEGLAIEFTDVAVVANKFRITSNFTVSDDSNPYLKLEYTNETVDSFADSGIEADIQLFNYIEIPGIQPSSYDLTSIEITYKDVNGVDLPDLDGINEVLFEPKGAVIDGWQRIAGDFTIPTDAAYMKITLRNNGSNLNAYFDDVRMLPFDSNMKSFVYDPITQRLMAELDENNYATFYEYDTEGGLVRVKKETERGVYTIQETRSGNSKLNVGE